MRLMILVGVLCFLSACQTPPSLNINTNADFYRITQGKSANELADLVYAQATAKYHNKFIDKCTKMEVAKLDNQVIFDNLLMDDLCGNQIANSSTEQIQALLQSGKSFRINEIKKTPTAKAMIHGGVVQVYRYYLMPERKLIGEFYIDKQAIQ